MNSVLLASGGMDSMMMWRLLGQPPILFCDLNQRYFKAECEALAQWTPPGSVVSTRIRLGDLEQEDGHIPFRNLALALVAAAAGYDTIYLGALAGETSRDKSGRFFRDVSRLLSFVENKRVRVIAPFRHLTKTELVRTYLESTDEVQSMRRSSGGDGSLLQDVSSRVQPRMAEESPAQSSAAREGQRAQLRSDVQEARHPHASALRRLWKPRESDAPSRLQQTFTGRLGVPTVPYEATRERLVQDLLRTRSCYEGRYPGCGRCQACFRRWVALYLNGVGEPYESNPWERRVDRREALRYLRASPLIEWPAIVRNNWQAFKAVSAAQKPY